MEDEKVKRIAKPRVNIDNVTFGDLTVIKYNGGGKQLCKCSCGKETEVATGFLIGGHRKSCGCKRYVRKQAENCRHCGATICDRNEFKSRTYSNGKKGKCSTCKYCKNKASFCLYSYEDPELEKLSVKRNGYIHNKVGWAKNGEIYKQRDYERKRESTANLDDNYIMKKLVSEGWSRDDVTQEIIESRRKAVKAYRERTGLSCKEDYFRYEYNGKKYNLSHYCKILSEVTGYGISTIRGRAKNGWSLDQIISTPVYQYRDEKREEYNKNVGAKIKIYDLDDNLLYECDTYSQAAEYLNTTISNVVSACNRSGIFQGKYKLRSKASTEENRIKVRQSSKKNNALFCRISYATEELTKDVASRSKKFNRQVYYKNNCDTIKQKAKEYYLGNREIKLDNNKVYYVKNRDYLQEKHREWVAQNREKWEDYHKNYRRKASDELTDVYIKTTLATTLGLSAAEITSKMIELKRKQIEIFRNLK